MSATSFKIGTGLYFIVMAMISSAVGGYLAGRLRTKWVGVQTTEVTFRDTAHGFLAWAVASVLGAMLLASPASSLIGAAASGATQGTANSAQGSSLMEGYVDERYFVPAIPRPRAKALQTLTTNWFAYSLPAFAMAT